MTPEDIQRIAAAVLAAHITVPNWDRDPRLPVGGEENTVGTALAVAQQRSWQAKKNTEALAAQVANLSPTLTDDQITQLATQLGGGLEGMVETAVRRVLGSLDQA